MAPAAVERPGPRRRSGNSDAPWTLARFRCPASCARLRRLSCAVERKELRMRAKVESSGFLGAESR
jgi:hypothetical protein